MGEESIYDIESNASNLNIEGCGDKENIVLWLKHTHGKDIPLALQAQ